MSEPTNKALVQCLLCLQELKSLAVHLKVVHNVTVAQYRERFGADVSVGWTLKGNKHKEELSQAKIERGGTLPPSQQPPPKADRTPEEEQYFKERFATLNREAGYDPTVEYVIRQIVHTEILTDRYQKMLNRITMTPTKMQDTDLKTYVDIIEKLNKQHMSLMDKMSLSREKRLAAKKSVETTPSRLVTAYAEELSRMTEAERRVQLEDERDAVRRFHHNQAALLEILPRSASGKDEDEDDDLDEPAV